MNNLIDYAKYQEHGTRLNNALQSWMSEQGDPGKAVVTTEAYEAAHRGEHIPLRD